MAEESTARRGRPKVSLEPDEPATDGYRRVLLHLATTVEGSIPGAISEADPEHLHELRVAVRRTRSVLRAAKGVLPPDVRRRRRADFGWLGAVTGPARDLDVQVLAWDHDVADLPADLRASLDPVRLGLLVARRGVHDEMDLALRSARCVDLLGGWGTWLRAPDAVTGEGPALGPVVARRVSRAHRSVIASGRAIDAASSPEDLHDLRKLAKHLRYLLDCFGGLFAKSSRKAVVRRLKALQDVLGAHQDADVSLGYVESLTLTGADAALARLTAALVERRSEARGGYAQAFAAFDSVEVAAELDELVRALR